MDSMKNLPGAAVPRPANLVIDDLSELAANAPGGCYPCGLSFADYLLRDRGPART